MVIVEVFDPKSPLLSYTGMQWWSGYYSGDHPFRRNSYNFILMPDREEIRKMLKWAKENPDKWGLLEK